jgi:hypothetical protein
MQRLARKGFGQLVPIQDYWLALNATRAYHCPREAGHAQPPARPPTENAVPRPAQIFGPQIFETAESSLQCSHCSDAPQIGGEKERKVYALMRIPV